MYTSPPAGRFDVRNSLHIQLALACLTAGACSNGGGARALNVWLTLIALTVAVSLPRLPLAYGVITGIWTALYGPFKALVVPNNVPWTIDLGTFAPFPIVNDMTTMFWLAYAGLISLGMPFGGCGAILGLLTFGAVYADVELFSLNDVRLGGGIAQTCIACIVHPVIGITLIQKMLTGFEQLRKHKAET